MNKNDFNDFDFSAALKRSMQQAVDYKNGDSAKVRIVVREKPTQKYTGDEVKRIRTELGLSQNGMALALGVSKRTIEAWEAGRISPRKATGRLLYLIDNNHELLDQLITV
jgi:putative transcriptional regulator